MGEVNELSLETATIVSMANMVEKLAEVVRQSDYASDREASRKDISKLVDELVRVSGMIFTKDIHEHRLQMRAVELSKVTEGEVRKIR